MDAKNHRKSLILKENTGLFTAVNCLIFTGFTNQKPRKHLKTIRY